MTNRLGAASQAGTGLTIFGREFNFDDLIFAVVDGWRPATARVTLRTDGLLSLPIDHELTGIKACLFACLPAVVGSRGANEIDLVVLLTLHEQLGIDISRVHNLLLGQRVFVFEAFMDKRRSRIIRDRGRGGFHVSNQMGCVLVTGFGQMDLIAHPGGTALFTVLRLGVLG